MTREEAIKWLSGLLDAYEEWEHGDYFYDNGDAVCEATSVAIAALREREGKDTNVPTKWIGVEDRLPEDGVRVLTACDDGIVRLGISKGEFPSVVNRQHRFSDVTHWMPLPEPPEVVK